MLVYGKNVVVEILKNNTKIHKAYIYKHFTDESIISDMQKKHIEIEYLDKGQLDNIANGNHQGIMVDIPDYDYFELDDLLKEENPLIVILDHLEDPHNFGAIIRTCEAAGVAGIIIPKDRSVEVNATVMKVSAGSLENMKVVMVTNLTQTINELKKQGFWFVGTDMEGQDYTTIDYKGKTAIVIGSEGDGMSRLVKESCDFIASIPMRGKTNSLNASVASGIIIYEALKSRK